MILPSWTCKDTSRKAAKQDHPLEVKTALDLWTPFNGYVFWPLILDEMLGTLGEKELKKGLGLDSKKRGENSEVFCVTSGWPLTQFFSHFFSSPDGLILQVSDRRRRGHFQASMAISFVRYVGWSNPNGSNVIWSSWSHNQIAEKLQFSKFFKKNWWSAHILCLVWHTLFLYLEAMNIDCAAP